MTRKVFSRGDHAIFLYTMDESTSKPLHDLWSITISTEVNYRVVGITVHVHDGSKSNMNSDSPPFLSCNPSLLVRQFR